jgi:nuclear pore complex protein Nup160
MAGEGADPAALLRIYLDFERFAEATSLVLEYIQAWSSLVWVLISWHIFLH